MGALRRLLNLWRDRSLDREFEEELLFHTEKRIEDNLRTGMSRTDAEAEARKHLGGAFRVKEGMREARMMCSVESILQDLRHGMRVFARQPGLTLLAVLTLSLGIGANATIFSLLNAALLQPLPFPDADRLVAIVDGFRTSGAMGVGPTVPELIDVRQSARDVEALSFYDTRDYQINGGTEPMRVFAARVESSFLSLLGAHPTYGRLFENGESLPGRDGVVILSDALWRRNFGGDPAVIGRQILLNGALCTVIGVLPKEFSFNYQSYEPIEMYVPFPMNDNYTSRSAPFTGIRRVSAIARLKTGHRIEWAAAELQAIARVLATEYPQLYRRGSDAQDSGFFMTAIPLHDALTGGNRQTLALLFTAVGLVLLIACVNTAQFLISRSAEREPEVAVRSAIGASRGRLARQFLTESILLAAAGGTLGIAQAFWLTKILVSILPGRLPHLLLGQIVVDGRVLAFAAAVAVLATLACGFVPALQFARHRSASYVAGRASIPLRARSRQILIAVEVAVSALLLVVAGLLVQSLRQLQNLSGGYSPEAITTMQMRLSSPQAIPAEPQFIDAIAAIPGVDSVAFVDSPLPVMPRVDFSIAGRPDDAATLSRQLASYHIVSPGYFATLRIPIREGRTFSNDDVAGRPPVAIINEEMARRFWPGQNPIGDRIRAGPGPRNTIMTVIGVVGNVRPLWQTEPIPQIYVSHRQQQEPNMTLLVRGSTSTRVSPLAIKTALRSVLPDQPVFNVRSFAEFLSEAVTDQRSIARLLGAFAFLAVFMSVSGVFTVVTYLTSRRTKEIAIRVAIGAKARDVLRVVAGSTLRSSAIGLMLGMAGAIAVSSAIRGVLRGVLRLEPVTLGIVGGLYLVVVTLAVCIPAWRAFRVDPSKVLRFD